MILVDYSSILHRKIHTSIAHAKPSTVDGKYVTADFVNLTKHYVFEELVDITRQHGSKFGELVICLDNSVGGYWRKDVFAGYKSARKTARDVSPVDFSAVFAEMNELVHQLRLNSPWRVLDIPRAEADDTMLVLAELFGASEDVLIHSPDKDMIQAQRGNDTVKQYSSLTGKWLTASSKADTMDAWVHEHVILGDASDGVPKVVDDTEFTPEFIKHLGAYDMFDGVLTPVAFRRSDVPVVHKRAVLSEFDIYRTNRKGESTGVLAVYKQIRFGPSTLKKQIEIHGTTEAWLDTHPLYREHYERNFTLVMAEGIPEYIRGAILESYRAAVTDYNPAQLDEYLDTHHLTALKMMLPNVFKLNREITAADFGW